MNFTKGKPNMKKQSVTIGLMAGLMALTLTVPSHAYVVDGLLNDWGVTLVQGLSTSSDFKNTTDWVPNSATADWAGGPGENGKGGPNNAYSLSSFGGERFDVESAYFDDDASYIYFAIVTSFPQAGLTVNGVHYETGDVAFNVYGGNQQTIGTKTFDYDYGIKTSGANFGKLYNDPTWSLPDKNNGWVQDAPSEFTGGSLVGNVNIVYYNLGIYDKGYTNYVIEGKVAKSLLGNPLNGESIVMHWTMSCGNDDITVCGDIDNNPPVPEPATLSLLGLGLLGFGLKKIRKQA